MSTPPRPPVPAGADELREFGTESGECTMRVRHLEVATKADGTATLLIPTACCGAKLYREHWMSVCPMCGRKAEVGGTAAQSEDHLYKLYGGARYHTA